MRAHYHLYVTADSYPDAKTTGVYILQAAGASGNGNGRVRTVRLTFDDDPMPTKFQGLLETTEFALDELRATIEGHGKKAKGFNIQIGLTLPIAVAYLQGRRPVHYDHMKDHVDRTKAAMRRFGQRYIYAISDGQMEKQLALARELEERMREKKHEAVEADSVHPRRGDSHWAVAG